jgi:hypothetical protein
MITEFIYGVERSLEMKIRTVSDGYGAILGVAVRAVATRHICKTTL